MRSFRAFAHYLDNFSTAYPQVKYYKFNFDQIPDIAKELGIRSLPTIYFFRAGDEMASVVGANPKGVEEGIKNLISAKSEDQLEY